MPRYDTFVDAGDCVVTAHLMLCVAGSVVWRYGRDNIGDSDAEWPSPAMVVLVLDYAGNYSLAGWLERMSESQGFSQLSGPNPVAG